MLLLLDHKEVVADAEEDQDAEDRPDRDLRHLDFLFGGQEVDADHREHGEHGYSTASRSARPIAAVSSSMCSCNCSGLGTFAVIPSSGLPSMTSMPSSFAK